MAGVRGCRVRPVAMAASCKTTPNWIPSSRSSSWSSRGTTMWMNRMSSSNSRDKLSKISLTTASRFLIKYRRNPVTDKLSGPHLGRAGLGTLVKFRWRKSRRRPSPTTRTALQIKSTKKLLAPPTTTCPATRTIWQPCKICALISRRTVMVQRSLPRLNTKF